MKSSKLADNRARDRNNKDIELDLAKVTAEKFASQSKKTTITLALDDNILQEIRKDSENLGLSVNAKINNILTSWVRMYKYHEMEQGMMLTARNFRTLLDNVSEEVIVNEFQNNALDMIPSFFIERNIPMTLDNLVEYAFKAFGLIGGAFQSVNIFTDEEGHKCVALRHRYGIKWSRVLAAGMKPHLSEWLNCPIAEKATPGVVTLVILDKSV